MHRRRFLELTAVGVASLTGCTGAPENPLSSATPSPRSTDTFRPTTRRTPTRTETRTQTPTDTPTETAEPTESPRRKPDAVFVGPQGSDSNAGHRQAPVATVQEAIDRAKPGMTIRVRPGEYREFFLTKRPGEPGAPITITGPESAVFRPPADLPESRIFFIAHSHVHLLGLTFDGLANPDRPMDPQAYAKNVIDAGPPTWQNQYPDYLRDIKIKPAAIGNARRHVIGTQRVNQLEIGEFRLLGPAGTENLYGDSVDHPSGGLVAANHIGEVVQIGAKHNVFDEGEGGSYVWDTPDESHDIHVHHIDNSEGHSHTELVELGTSVYDALIEFCTDAGGAGKYFLSEDHAAWTETSMGIRGGRCTLRWCAIENGFGSGVQVGTPPGFDRNLEKYQAIPAARFPGTNNSVYGNRIVDNAGLAIAFPYELYQGHEVDMGPAVQDVICGNVYNGETQADPDQPCSESVPTIDEIGHLGGDSPWR